MSLSKMVLVGIERKSGLTSAQIRNLSPEELRDYLTKRIKKGFRVITEFPTIGRGDALRDGITSSVEINMSIDKILGIT